MLLVFKQMHLGIPAKQGKSISLVESRKEKIVLPLHAYSLVFVMICVMKPKYEIWQYNK